MELVPAGGGHGGVTMRNCILDGREIRDRGDLHDRLALALGFPEWYGRNLDALYDCLTDSKEETEIRILHEAALRESLGRYATVLGKVLWAAQEANSKVQVLFL